MGMALLLLWTKYQSWKIPCNIERTIMTALRDSDIRKLISEGYKQISRKYGIIARLPNGKGGIESLVDVSDRKDARLWAEMLGETAAGDYFRRCHADRLGLTKVLSQGDLSTFRELGGESA